jgi:2-(1,2-epoxy-1,2-dihydrophenyl)acetyl-CoA isomerase
MSILLVERRAAVAIVTLNRPESRNALNVALLVALRAAFESLGADSSVRAIVLAGSGAGFCAGADVKEWADETHREEPASDWVAEAMSMMKAVRDCPRPVIARIDGACVGAGLDLALCCDFRYASERAKFTCSYTHVGYSPDAGGTWLLPRVLGLQTARRFIYTGELWLGTRAKDEGLVDAALPIEELDAAVTEFADALATGPTIAIAESKRLLATTFENPFAVQLALEQAAGLRCAATSDHQESLAAANEKRRPVFMGR